LGNSQEGKVAVEVDNIVEVAVAVAVEVAVVAFGCQFILKDP
jgi:hypothetical protein